MLEIDSQSSYCLECDDKHDIKPRLKVSINGIRCPVCNCREEYPILSKIKSLSVHYPETTKNPYPCKCGSRSILVDNNLSFFECAECHRWGSKRYLFEIQKTDNSQMWGTLWSFVDAMPGEVLL